MENPINPEKENNRKNVLVVLLMILFILLVVIAYLFLRNQSDSNLKKMNDFASIKDTKTTSEQILDPEDITDNTNSSEEISGTVTFIDQNKISIKQFASDKPDYNFSKSDFNQIVTLKLNPTYDKNAADAALREWEKNIQNNPNQDTKPPLPIDSNQKLYIEALFELDDISLGTQVTAEKKESGEMKLTVYPKEIDISPSAPVE